MSKRKKPKFQLGDIVVMVLYGIVGEVTEVKELDNVFMYELDGNDGFYLEKSLISLDEFHEKDVDFEQINIDYKFFFGDLVKVPNVGSDIYKVIGFRTEIWRYRDESWEDIIYELARVDDGDWLECAEEEMILVSVAKDADGYLRKKHAAKNSYGALSKTYSRKQLPFTTEIAVKPLNKSQKEEKINHLLDLYSDYKCLKLAFGDEEFDKVLQMIVDKLKKLTNIEDE